MKVLVAGGTGTAGRPTVAELARRGHEVRVLSRHGRGPNGQGDGQVTPGRIADGGPVVAVRGDVTTGAGLAQAMDGVDAVVDTTNIITVSEKAATAFFSAGAQHLTEAAAPAGVRHHVMLSIVGIDLVQTGYYRGKVAQERAVEAAASAGGVRWSVLRATQFHEFAVQMLARLQRGPIALMPVMSLQPVSTLDVAAALADAVELGPGPSGRLPELAGPEVLALPDMVRGVLDARGERALVVPLPLPGAAGRAMRRGALRPASGTPVRIGMTRFDDYLRALRSASVTEGAQR